MKDILCKAFCDNLIVRDVPAGTAVGTPFTTSDGDRVGFYIVPDGGLHRVEDDGLTMPLLEASGLDFSTGTRAEALGELLAEYGVQLDPETQAFFIAAISEAKLATIAMRFVAFSLRVRDFLLMTEARVVSSFRDDVSRLLRETIASRAIIREQEAITPSLQDFVADFVLEAPGRQPVGVFLGTSNARVLEAVVVQMRAIHETRDKCSIIALLERGQSITAAIRRQASNRLNAVPEFRGDEIAAIQRIAYEALGEATAAIH
jgi:hypothetical protein